MRERSTFTTLSILFLLLLLLALTNLPVRVIDGDTFVTITGEKIRLVDIDAPERGEPGYMLAKQRLEELVLLRPIFVQRVGRDKYGRTLAYVFNPELVNLKLVQEGLATPYVYEQHKFTSKILESARDVPFCLRIDVHPNAPGNDWENLNGEWIRLKNRCPKEFQGSIVIVYGGRNVGLNLQLPFMQELFIFTGCGEDGNVYLCSRRPLLRNAGDCLDVYVNGFLYARRCWGDTNQ